MVNRRSEEVEDIGSESSTVEERPGEAGFTMLLEPPNEAPAKAGFGGAVLHLLLGIYDKGGTLGKLLFPVSPHSDSSHFAGLPRVSPH